MVLIKIPPKIQENIKTAIGKPSTIDFYVEEINGVRGVCIVSPRILERDNPSLFGVPFIFYVGSGQYIDSLPLRLRNTDVVVRELRKKGVAYLTEQQYKTLIDGMGVDHKVPEAVKVGDRLIPIEWLVKKSYVPYSFGSNHDSDVLNKARVRTQNEYNDMLAVLSDIRRSRK